MAIARPMKSHYTLNFQFPPMNSLFTIAPPNSIQERSSPLFLCCMWFSESPSSYTWTWTSCRLVLPQLWLPKCPGSLGGTWISPVLFISQIGLVSTAWRDPVFPMVFPGNPDLLVLLLHLVMLNLSSEPHEPEDCRC